MSSSAFFRLAAAKTSSGRASAWAAVGFAATAIAAVIARIVLRCIDRDIGEIAAAENAAASPLDGMAWHGARAVAIAGLPVHPAGRNTGRPRGVSRSVR